MPRKALQSLISLVALTAICATGPQSEKSTLYYFNPDSPQSNLSRLKRDMDDYFNAAGFRIEFQPFAHLVDLEQQLEKKPPDFLFVPRWYWKKHSAKLDLRRILVASRKGRTSYQKVLLGKKHTNLARPGTTYFTVAMTSMGSRGTAILKKTLSSSSPDAAHKIDPIIVSKDMDALFALALSQVDMAFVVKENLTLVAKINPNIMQMVHPLVESEPIPMPVLCYANGVASSSNVQELKELFLKGRSHKKFLRVMEMLRIHDWQAVDN